MDSSQVPSLTLILSGGSLVAVLSFGWSIWSYLQKQLSELRDELGDINKELAATSVKAAAAWDFVWRRGIAEGKAKGLLEQNSPVRIVNKVHEVFDPVRKEFGDWWLAEGRFISDADAIAVMERRWGEWISKTVCPALEIFAGACVVLALLVAKEEAKSREADVA